MDERHTRPISDQELLCLINTAVQESALQHIKTFRACAVAPARRLDDPRRFVVTAWSGGTEFAHMEAQRMVVDFCVPAEYYLAN